MTNEDLIAFLLWKKIYSNGRFTKLFQEFVNEKVEADQKEILSDLDKINELFNKINKKLN